jgi:hypothetical protein
MCCSARFLQAGLACDPSIPIVPPTTNGGGWLRLLQARSPPAAAAARFLSSFVIDFTPPLPCVPWLRGRYPVPRYSGRSDSRRAALRASTGHEHRSGPDGSPGLAPPHFPPFRPQPPRRPSPSICARSRFCLLVAASQKTLRPGRGILSHLGHGPGLGSHANTFCMGGLWPSAGRLASRRGRIGFNM